MPRGVVPQHDARVCHDDGVERGDERGERDLDLLGDKRQSCDTACDDDRLGAACRDVGVRLEQRLRRKARKADVRARHRGEEDGPCEPGDVGRRCELAVQRLADDRRGGLVARGHRGSGAAREEPRLLDGEGLLDAGKKLRATGLRGDELVDDVAAADDGDPRRGVACVDDDRVGPPV